METKPCRHCCQPIAAQARRCQHCHGFQTWFASPRDPRLQILLPVVLVSIFAIFIFFMRDTIESGESHGEAPKLEVSDVSTRIVPASDGQRIFIIGRVKNASAHDAAHVVFRVNLFGEDSQLLDTFVSESGSLVVPGNGSAMFRVVAPTSAANSEIKRTEALVERAKTRTKWD